MANVELRAEEPGRIACDALVLFAFEDGLSPAAKVVDSQLGGSLQALSESGDVKGKLHEATIVHALGRLPARRLLILGAGKQADLTADRAGKLAGQAAGMAASHHWQTAVIPLTELRDDPEFVEAVAADALVGGVKLDLYRTSERQGGAGTLVIAGSGAEHLAAAAARGRGLGEGVNLARTLGARSGNDLTPDALAGAARQVASEGGLSAQVLGPAEMRERGMGCILAVGQGSDQEPRLVSMRYGEFPDRPTVAFVGKGITFDSGGISIKPAAGMEDMKMDMCGAAAVIGAMKVIAERKPCINVLGVCACAENLPSGRSLKPGDVIRGLSGKTVEVVNTDAEGRLVLADAVAWAQELGATQIVDLATLTGSCVVALGNVAAGAMGTPEAWVERVVSTGRGAGEKLWPLPLYDEYRDMIKSDVADIKNSGGRQAGAITGAWFVGEFVREGTQWCHLDIAGTAWLDKDLPYRSKGASGYGVRTLVALADALGAQD